MRLVWGLGLGMGLRGGVERGRMERRVWRGGVERREREGETTNHVKVYLERGVSHYTREVYRGGYEGGKHT